MKKFEAHPELIEEDGYVWSNIGMTLAEIEWMESRYNGGSPFPRALRELLYIGGKDCYVMDMLPGDDSYIETQDRARWYMNNVGLIFERPFFCVDTNQCFSGDAFNFVYTDAEASDDPTVYSCRMEANIILATQFTLTEWVEFRVGKVLEGLNPF